MCHMGKWTAAVTNCYGKLSNGNCWFVVKHLFYFFFYFWFLFCGNCNCCSVLWVTSQAGGIEGHNDAVEISSLSTFAISNEKLVVVGVAYLSRRKSGSRQQKALSIVSWCLHWTQVQNTHPSRTNWVLIFLPLHLSVGLLLLSDSRYILNWELCSMLYFEIIAFFQIYYIGISHKFTLAFLFA